MGTYKVGIWIRVSTDMQAFSDSPEHHKERALWYAKARDWDVVETYHLEGLTGKSINDYPEFKRMKHDIETGRINGLIFSKLARLGRNARELLDVADFFEEHDASLISLGEAIDTSTPAGRLFYTMLSALAQWEREEISARVSASIPVRAKLGKSLGGQAPFGYAWENKKLVINEDEAIVRRHMYDLFLKHKRKLTVAKALNEQGYRTRKGSLFTQTTVSRLLSDPIVSGVRITNYSTQKKGKKEIKGEDDWIYSESPALISEETYKAIEAILKEQKEQYTQPLKKTLHLFTGFVECSCGGNMYVRSNSKKYVCKECKRKIPKDDLELVFKEQLESFALDKDSLDMALQENAKQEKSVKGLLLKTEKELTQIKEKIDNIFSLHSKGQIPTLSFKQHHEPLFERQQALGEQESKLLLDISEFHNNTQKISKILSTLQDVYGSWDTLNHESKRNIIESMTDKIIIDEQEITISLKQLSPFPSELTAFGGHKHKDS